MIYPGDHSDTVVGVEFHGLHRGTHAIFMSSCNSAFTSSCNSASLMGIRQDILVDALRSNSISLEARYEGTPASHYN